MQMSCHVYLFIVCLPHNLRTEIRDRGDKKIGIIGLTSLSSKYMFHFKLRMNKKPLGHSEYFTIAWECSDILAVLGLNLYKFVLESVL